MRRRYAMPLAALGVLTVLAPAASEAQKRGKKKDRFEDTTTVVQVEIPVQVIQDGEPVRGLTAADFEITEGRRKRPIVGFHEVDLSLEQAVPAAEIPIVARRHFLFLFDMSLSDPNSIAKARHAAIELAERGLHPADLAGVATYSTTQGLQMPLGFTSDRYQLRVAIESLGLPQLVQEVRDPLGIMITGLSDFSPAGEASAGGGAGAGAGGRPDVEAEVLELLESMVTTTRRNERKNDVLALTSSLAELAGLMKSVYGRKHVVFLSEGFDSSVLLGTGVSTLEEQQSAQQQTDAAMSGRIWEVDSNARFGDTSAQNALQLMAQAFLRADCTIQAVDTGGLRAGGAIGGSTADSGAGRRREDGLYMMAENTGGEFYRNFNNLSEAMGKMLTRTSLTYVLAIQPEDLDFDGSFHRLKVRLAKNLKGAKLVHKPGYFAPLPYGEQTPFERRVSAAGLIMGGESGGGVDTAVLATPFPMDLGHVSYVPVLIEVGGTSLLAEHSEEVLPTEIYAYAIDSSGTIRDYFSRILGFDMAKAGDVIRNSGLKYWGHFELEPGDYVVRVLVRNGLTGAFGVERLTVRVPDVDGGEVAVLPPLFPEPSGKWLLGREKDEDRADVDYPYFLGETPFVPAAKPVLQQGQVVPVSLVGFNLGDGPLEVSSEVRALDGTKVGTGEIALDDRPTTEAVTMDRLLLRFAPTGLAAGQYTLDITVRDGGSGTSRTTSLPIVVTG